MLYSLSQQILLAGITPSPLKKKKSPRFSLDKGLKLGKIGYNLILVSKVSYFSALQTSNH